MNQNFLNRKHKKQRIPGKYPDVYSEKKVKNNIYILHACKLLKSYYTNNGITALILDGKEMRTTNTLLKLDSILKKLIIVESNKVTYNEMNSQINSMENGLDKIKTHNCLMENYLTNQLDPNINLVYFDLMENFFSSDKSDGSGYSINNFLQKSEVDEMIFAATFCLRSSQVGGTFDIEVKKILIFLKQIFLGNGFDFKLLNNKNSMRYKGQKANNKSLMFVLYKLTKFENEINEN